LVNCGWATVPDSNYKVATCGVCDEQMPDFTIAVWAKVRIADRLYRCPNCHRLNSINL
jgi:hypothetical protein